MSSVRDASLGQVLPRAAQIVRRFSPQLRKQRKLIAGSFVALIFSTAFKLLEPWPLKLLIDRVLHSSEVHGAKWNFMPLIGSMKRKELLYACVGCAVLFVTMRALFEYLHTIGFAKVGNRVLKEVRDQLYRHLQRLSLSFHGKTRNGDMTIRVVGDVNMLRDALVSAVLPLLASILVVAGMWTVMFIMQWKLALAAMATTPLLWFHTQRTGGKIREAAKRQRQREGEMASTAAESLAGIKLVQALSLENAFAEDFSSRNNKSQKEEVRNAKLTAGMERTVDVLLAVATGLVLFIGARLVLAHRMTIGDLTVFLFYLRRAFNPVQDFAKYTSRLAKATAAGERVIDLLNQQPEVIDRPGAIVAPHLRGAIAIDDVSFAYDAAHPVLHGIDLDIAPGEHVAIVGPSGGGKSTLASLLLRLYDPTDGAVRFDGRDLRDYTYDSLRSQISVVLQETLLFAGTVRDNIRSSSPDASDDDVVAAAKLANAHAFIQSMPHGYDTVIGERGVTLSGGQRQRLAIARAALRHSPILIFDEPTSGLDETNIKIVNAALCRLAEDRTAIFITHDLQLAVNADQVVFVDCGRVIERGTHEQLMQLGGRYATMYTQQATRVQTESIEPLSISEAEHAVAG